MMLFFFDMFMRPASIVLILIFCLNINHRIYSQYLQEGPKLVGNGNPGTQYLGGTVAISRDGTTAFIGGNRYNNLQGAVWIFKRVGKMGTIRRQTHSRSRNGNITLWQCSCCFCGWEYPDRGWKLRQQRPGSRMDIYPQ
jgi:hypothetical protein